MEHTPGPWEVHEHFHVDGEFWCSIGYNGFGPITDVVGEEGDKTRYYQPVAGMKYLVTPVKEQKANAKLIAAAPELLEECKAWLSSYDGWSDVELSKRVDIATLDRIKFTRAVVAKVD